jgi:ribosomal protein S18 acetylase RimI-like enzyme
MTIEIRECTDLTSEVVAAFARLVPQLSRSNPAPTEAELAEIVGSPATALLLAHDLDEVEGPSGSPGDEIVGSLTLALFRLPTGLRAWIEDVVVDEGARGRGVGEALNRAALELARRAGARTVDLTSRPSREAANRLYRRIGFEPRETNVYRYDLAGGS